MTFNPALAFVTCPRGCQVATPPEPLPRSRYVCSGCGHEFEFQARSSSLNAASVPGKLRRGSMRGEPAGRAR